MLFVPPHEELSDEEIAAALRQAIAGAGRLPRDADVFLAGVRRALGRRTEGGGAGGEPAGNMATASVNLIRCKPENS